MGLSDVKLQPHEKLALKVLMRVQMRGKSVSDVIEEMCEEGILQRDPDAIKGLTWYVMRLMESWEFI